MKRILGRWGWFWLSEKEGRRIRTKMAKIIFPIVCFNLSVVTA
jgi:hypothetical protein